MTNIVAFKPRAVRKGGPAAQPQSPASVIIFPGVRYERSAAVSAERTARKAPVVREPALPNTT